jgi:hypothetical protein
MKSLRAGASGPPAAFKDDADSTPAPTYLDQFWFIEPRCSPKPEASRSTSKHLSTSTAMAIKSLASGRAFEVKFILLCEAQYLQETVARPRRGKKGHAAVATARDEVHMPQPVSPFKTLLPRFCCQHAHSADSLRTPQTVRHPPPLLLVPCEIWCGIIRLGPVVDKESLPTVNASPSFKGRVGHPPLFPKNCMREEGSILRIVRARSRNSAGKIWPANDNPVQ